MKAVTVKYKPLQQRIEAIHVFLGISSIPWNSRVRPTKPHMHYITMWSTHAVKKLLPLVSLSQRERIGYRKCHCRTFEYKPLIGWVTIRNRSTMRKNRRIIES